MRQPTTEQLLDLVAEHEAPCISLYQPTHRHHPDNQQDPIRYRNMLDDMEKSLKKKYSKDRVQTCLEKFQSLARDSQFWNHRTEGLAILSSPNYFQVFELQRSVPQLIIVADSFHTKPLLRAYQSADRYQILAIGRHEAKLYEGNRYALDPVELTDMPSTITDALGEELTEPHLTVASYARGSFAPRGAHGAPAAHHGHSSKDEEVDVDRDRFFRVIDRGILEHHSRPSGLPLMLAALPEYHAPFRAVSHNPFLMPSGIEADPEAMGLEKMRTEAWKIVEPRYLQRLAELVDSFQVAKARQLGSDDLDQIADAAVGGRVSTLLVEDDRQIAGKIEPENGRIQPGDLSDPDVDDVLDDLAETVLRMKGDVVVVPSERMPCTTGAAAVFRY